MLTWLSLKGRMGNGGYYILLQTFWYYLHLKKREHRAFLEPGKNNEVISALEKMINVMMM